MSDAIFHFLAVWSLLMISHQLRRIRVALGETVKWWQL
jgi:hypothetical protein